MAKIVPRTDPLPRLGHLTNDNVLIAAWVKDLQQKHGAPGVNQQLAAVRCCSTGSSPANRTDEPGGGGARAQV
jgi:hypothetical protein